MTGFDLPGWVAYFLAGGLFAAFAFWCAYDYWQRQRRSGK